MAIAMGWHKPDNVAGSSAPAIMIGLFVATGGLLFGYDTGYASTLWKQEMGSQGGAWLWDESGFGALRETGRKRDGETLVEHRADRDLVAGPSTESWA
jgi:hypothetical protein